MNRRILTRLGVAGAALVVVAFSALTVLILATSTPAMVPLATASPNDQVRLLEGTNPGDALTRTDLAFEDVAHPGASNAACKPQGRWLLDVNPDNVIGHPYVAMPTLRDWERAAEAIGVASSICRVGVLLTWVGHDPAHRSSDRWMALLPASALSGIDAPFLRRYAVRHAWQT